MHPLSHDALVHTLKHRISQSGYNITSLCLKANIRQSELEDVLAKKAIASNGLLAKLGFVFGIDFRQLAVSYALWRFEVISAKIAKEAQIKARPANIFHIMAISDQMIRDHPHMDTPSLVELVHSTLRLDESAIRNQIASVRGRQTGDYSHYG